MVTVGECNLVWWQGKVAAQAQGATGSTRSTWRWFVQVKAGLQRTRGESKPPNISPTTHPSLSHLNLPLPINQQTFPCFSPKLISLLRSETNLTGAINQPYNQWSNNHLR